MTKMEETRKRISFEFNTAIEDRAVELFMAGVDFSEMTLLVDGEKTYLYAFGKPDSVFWVDAFGYSNEGYTVTVRGESCGGDLSMS